MLNVERIWRHRAVILAALSAYEVRVKKVNKEEEALEIDSDDSEDRLAIIEELRGEFRADTASSGTGIEGTPMGDALAAQVYQAEDGTPLDVDSLDELLRGIDIDVPLGHIGEWSLDMRREVYAWWKRVTEAKMNETPIPEDHPEFLRDEWFLADDATESDASEDELERAFANEEELTEWLVKGPWGVFGDGPSDDWAIRKPNPDDGTLEPEKRGVAVEHSQRYGQVDRARLIAANLNRIAAATTTTAPQGEVTGHAPTVSTGPQLVE